MTHKKLEVPFEDRATLRVKEAAGIYGVGRSTLFELLKTRKIQSVKIGGARLLSKASLDSLFLSAANDSDSE